MRKFDPLNVKTENTVRHDLQSPAKNVNAQQRERVTSTLTKNELFCFNSIFYDYTKRPERFLD